MLWPQLMTCTATHAWCLRALQHSPCVPPAVCLPPPALRKGPCSPPPPNSPPPKRSLVSHHEVFGLQQSPHDVQHRGLAYAAVHLTRLILNSQGGVAALRDTARHSTAQHGTQHINLRVYGSSLCSGLHDLARLVLGSPSAFLISRERQGPCSWVHSLVHGAVSATARVHL